MSAAGAGGTLWGSGEPLDPALDAYTAAEDRVWDRRLLLWDIAGTMAHVHGLARARLISGDEEARLHSALRDALDDAAAGRLTVTGADEDVHTALERYLTERLGEIGEKVHTGRSRNDQVAADLRLHIKHGLLRAEELLVDAAGALIEFGARHQRVLWPGYTHGRRAMPSTVGLWAAGYAELLLDDLGPLEAARALADRSPLGSAAGYGVPLPLEREEVAERLGFAGLQECVTSVQAARGKLEGATLAALWCAGCDLGKLSRDVVLFSSDEFGFLVLPRSLATGSSIMPHKRNPDLFELTRGRAAEIAGLAMQVMGIAMGLPGGYHRDLQLTKGPLVKGIDTLCDMARAVGSAVPLIEVDPVACRRAVDAGCLATEEVMRRVVEGVPFRRAYREVAAAVAAGEPLPRPSDEEILARRESFAGPSLFEKLAARRREAEASVRLRRLRFREALDALAGRPWPFEALRP
ncbi:MAG: argininosuccinate lyase [Acidobacteria bacterium]|nr:MAG: argininosuccinate lyase [Acidobacteriota bacterium]